jgi:fermentation-respiration switch protein FrsA (DUF1100 family)
MTDQQHQHDDQTVPSMTRRGLLMAAGTSAAAVAAMSFANTPAAFAQAGGHSGGNGEGGPDNWYTSDKVTVEKVAFDNQYGMEIVGNLFRPKRRNGRRKLPAVIVGHPNGAVKEQSANLYGTKLAEQGFAALAIDQAFWGESEGEPRQSVLPDLYTESFIASVDFLGTQEFVDRERIGVLGICGSGGFVIGAAKLDPRMKAIATVSMYDMGAVNRNGLNHSQSLEQRKQVLAEAAEQRYTEFTGGDTPWSGGAPLEIDEDYSDIGREFYDFYRTPRGEFTPEGATPDSTTRRKLTAETKFMNFYPFNDIETISPRPMLFVTGDQAHSREFSQDAYARAAEPKELLWVRGAGHVDLYDDTSLIPFDRLTSFFDQHLAA